MKLNCISLILITLIASINADSCSPSNCSAECSPGCTVDEVCTLGTMLNCGVCPTSHCLPRSSIPNVKNIESSSSSTRFSSGTIGGIAGGLVGGGLVLGASGYIFIRRKNKNKNNLPRTFRHQVDNSSTTNTSPSRDIDGKSRKVISGIIPVAFVPPTNSNHSSICTSYYSEAETPRSHIASFSTFAQNQNENNNNTSNSRPISVATSFLTTTTNAESKRDSVESIVLQHRTATIKATQILRTKPQIMRVNTVRVQDNLARSGSLKRTIQPQSSNDNETSVEDPFDDIHAARQSINSINTCSTDSVAKSRADGEITIFFQ